MLKFLVLISVPKLRSAPLTFEKLTTFWQNAGVNTAKHTFKKKKF